MCITKLNSKGRLVLHSKTQELANPGFGLVNAPWELVKPSANQDKNLIFELT